MAVIRKKSLSPLGETFSRKNEIAFSPEHIEEPLNGDTRFQNGDSVDYWPGLSWEEGDKLIFGYFSASTTLASIGTGISLVGIAGIITSTNQPSLGLLVSSLIALPFGMVIFWISLRTRANRFIVFDRKHQVTHTPKKLSAKHDSIKWRDTSFFIFDEGYLHRPMTYSNTNITLVPPPLDGKKGEVPGPYGIGRLIFLQGLHVRHYNSAEAEAIYRYIVAFMTQPPDKSILREIQQTEQAICNEEYDGDRDAMRRHLGWFWYRLDLEKLPNQPNWIRHPNGRWERTGPGVKVLRPWWDNLIKPRRIPKNQGTEKPGT
ncbi:MULTISPECIES: hypothetical protein [unclassified Ectothiorhodospira]|uniref:hypothetical protein n=1 Tax=unclassified Ectothiorhodospira TaxID=2684909 RepID=UPI001EE957F1|nr:MULTISPECIES: hypothetical protein [unclassified Ectothiorhodospira]MCG5515354.1 hypothetical protein [Ectothiorhodospira sp. 9100]MCG5519232.1 hypothetical protein [Ectothiorhodospira sp. 9905]